MGGFLGQAYVRILLGPEIGDVWVGEAESTSSSELGNLFSLLNNWSVNTC